MLIYLNLYEMEFENYFVLIIFFKLQFPCKSYKEMMHLNVQNEYLINMYSFIKYVRK